MPDAIKYPHVTEKAVDKMDFENKLLFICQPGAAKGEIRDEVESQFDVTVVDVNTMVTPNCSSISSRISSFVASG